MSATEAGAVTARPVWRALAARLDTLMRDDRLQVRCNVLSLAAAVAGEDPEALAALAAMGAQAIRRLLDREDSGEQQLLQAWLEERSAMATPLLRQGLDAEVVKALDKGPMPVPADRLSESLARVPDQLLPLLPEDWLVRGIIADAKAMAGKQRDRGYTASVETMADRALRLVAAVKRLSPEARGRVREQVMRGCEALESASRRGAVLALLQYTPELLAPVAGQVPLVSWPLAREAAALARERPIARVWRLLLGSAVGALLVCLLLALGPLGAQVQGKADILADVLGAGTALAFWCYLSNLPLAWLHRPGIGGLVTREPLRQAASAAMLGTLGLLLVELPSGLLGWDAWFNSGANEGTGSPWTISFWLGVVQFAACALTAGMVAPVRTWMEKRGVPEASLLHSCMAAGPGAGLVTLVCVLGHLIHGHAAFLQFWPLLLAGQWPFAHVLVSSESAGGPIRPLSRKEVQEWPRHRVQGLAALWCVPLALGLFSFHAARHMRSLELRLEAPQAAAGWGKPQSRSVILGARLPVVRDASLQEAPVRVRLETDSQPIVLFNGEVSSSKPVEPAEGETPRRREFRLADKEEVCIGDCDRFPAPEKIEEYATWLPGLLSTPRFGDVRISLWTAAAAGADYPGELPVLLPGAVVSLPSGHWVNLAVRATQAIDISVPAAATGGALGSPGTLVMVNQDDKPVARLRPGENAVRLLPGGTSYRACAYFGPSDAPACERDPKLQLAPIESGSLAVQLKEAGASEFEPAAVKWSPASRSEGRTVLADQILSVQVGPDRAPPFAISLTRLAGLRAEPYLAWRRVGSGTWKTSALQAVTLTLDPGDYEFCVPSTRDPASCKAGRMPIAPGAGVALLDFNLQ